MSPSELTANMSADEKGKLAAYLMMEAGNDARSRRNDMIDSFVDTLSHDHRTLQQNAIYGMVTSLVAYGKANEDRVDLRNQASVSFCNELAANVPALPYI